MLRSVNQKIDFVALEKEIFDRWYKSGIVEKYLHKNDSSEKRFSFIDGPITANNPMGVHHGWGRTYKDLWQRFWNMRGYKQRFQNGFDCQGLWVEVEVEKELGIKNKKDIENLVDGDRKASIAKFVELCKARVLKFSAIQTEQTKRLGNFMDWDNSYFTMSDENNYMIWHFLKVVHEKGWIYKGRDSVPWCPRCETAISQHEMLTEDYKELTHETVFFKLPIITKGWESTSLVAWTTTPWTIPANVALGVNIKFTYQEFHHADSGEKVILIKKDENGNSPLWSIKGKEQTAEAVLLGADNKWQSVREIKGSDLLGIKYEGPFDHLPRVQKAKEKNQNTFHTVVDGSEIVVAGEGTGILHVAPGAGKEDFDLGKKEKLPVISVIADDASYLEDMDKFSGKNAKKHPEVVIDFLKEKDRGKYLLKTMNYTHRYPACWRCRSELVWKVADEWYIAMDKKDESGKTYREQMVEVAKKIKWLPKWGLDRELDWLKNMHDWLISKKNRYWGLALPIYECHQCKTFEVIGSEEELKERAVAGWEEFDGKSPHKPFIDEVKILCTMCKKEISRLDDVGNVWLDAGIVPFSTLVDPSTKQVSYLTDKKYWKEWFPADFVTESFPGQFKNWFYSLIAMSTALEKTAPLKNLLGYATVVAEDGRAMHKSWGNSIEFNEGADKIGVDVMRWMYASNDPEHNLPFGYKRGDETRRKFHLLVWNIYNFFVTYANADGWEPIRHSGDPDKSGDSRINSGKMQMTLSVLDTWILSRLHNTITLVTNSLEKYNSYSATSEIEHFVNDLSLWYVRRSRDRVGSSSEEASDKDAFYDTLYTVLTTLTRILAPFTPFIAEEIYINLTGEKSVHLADWPESDLSLYDSELEIQMTQAMTLVSVILSLRKKESIKVKLPLKILSYKGPAELHEEILKIVKDEVNVYELKYMGLSDEYSVDGDMSEANQDKQAGLARDIIRLIQGERKKLETTVSEQVDVTLNDWPEKFEEEIKKKALIRNLTKGESFSVKRIK